MEFNNTKKGILDFYETTDNVIKEHKKTFSKLINKLNEPSSITNKLTNNLDVFMENSFNNFHEFKNNLTTLDDDKIKFVFDMNKNDYVNFTLPNKNIISIKKFICNCYSRFIHNNANQVESFLTPQFCNNDGNAKNIFVFNENSYNIHVQNFLNNNQTCLFCFYKSSTQLEIWIDDYLNIYIPLIQTYLITNYSKYPLYGFYTNMDKLNLFNNNIDNNIEILSFNDNNTNDKQLFQNIGQINSATYLSSEDERISYKPRFITLLDFYKYKEKLEFFSQYLSLSINLEKLLPIKNENDSQEKVENENNLLYLLDNEHKIFNQSQKIRELEITNEKQNEEIQHLRKERLHYIETDHTNTSVLNDYKKLLEELNKQLTTEFDNLSNKQKEILNLKNINIEYSNIKSNYRILEDKIENINNEKNKLLENISKYKSENSTLIDKNTEITSKLVEERYNINEQNTKLKNFKIQENLNKNTIDELEKNITIEKEQHQLSKNKINDLTLHISDINNSNNSNKNSNDNIKYQNILLTQLKEKNGEIEKIKKNYDKISKDFELNKKNYDKLKLKVFNLFNQDISNISNKSNKNNSDSNSDSDCDCDCDCDCNSDSDCNCDDNKKTIKNKRIQYVKSKKT